MHRLIAALCLVAGCAAAAADPSLHLRSPTARVALIELYTSEGCSSCPPADRWLRSLERDPRLWRAFVPVAFHVDYWDALGWPDRFARPAYGERQRAYVRDGHLSQVYTPGLMLAGEEWRGWFTRPALVLGTPPPAGVLAVDVDAGRIEARFSPRAPANALVLNVARLGFGLSTPVSAGENAGRRLEHAFVVLGLETVPLRREGGAWKAAAPIPKARLHAPRAALAAWVSRPDDPSPIQAVGAWLR